LHMSSEVLPTVFVSHGAPTLALDPGETGVAWRELAGELPRPEAILCVSAHWITDEPALSAPLKNETIHDFYGFPEPLYRMHYNPPAAPALAHTVRGLLASAGFTSSIDGARGLDHGAWVPLGVMYPKADIPTTQLSIQLHRDANWHYRLGKALRQLREAGVLILASGGAVHNLRALARAGGPPADWAQQFDEWLADALAEGRTAELLDWAKQAPFALMAQPTPDHFLPLFVALGASGEDGRAARIHQGFTLGSLSMAAFQFR
jgi:4,5-DOPA dioxygenase extradiol